MVDYVEQLHEQAQVDSSPNFAQLREEATVKFKSLQERAQAVITVIENPEAVAKLRSGSDRDKNLEMLKSEYNVSVATFIAEYRLPSIKSTLCTISVNISLP